MFINHLGVRALAAELDYKQNLSSAEALTLDKIMIGGTAYEELQEQARTTSNNPHGSGV